MNDAVEFKEYQGNCHCGLVRFKVKIPELKRITTCKCSFCVKNGIIWKFPISDDALEIENCDKLTLYEFGARTNEHFFCPRCGSSVFSRGKESKGNGINVRMLKDFDWEELEEDEYPGASIAPAYEPPQFPSASTLGSLTEGEDIYHGNCHCKAVKFTVKTKSLQQQQVIKCNCSLCSKNGDHFIHPPASAVILDGGDNLENYAFLDEKSLHSFCKICGVAVCVKVLHENEDLMPLNVRTFHNINLEELSYNLYNGAKNAPLYEDKQHNVGSA